MRWRRCLLIVLVSCARLEGAGTPRDTPLASVSPGYGFIDQLALDDAYVYVLRNHGDAWIDRIPKGGGRTEEVVRFHGASVDRFALDATSFYVSPNMTGASAIWKVSKDGKGPRLTLAARPPGDRFKGGSAIALDDDFLYFASGTTVRRIKKTGGEETAIASGQRDPVALAVDERYVYWINYLAADVWRASKVGGAPVEKIATMPATTMKTDTPLLIDWALVADGDALYWMDGGELFSVPKTGGLVQAVAHTVGTGRHVRGFAVDHGVALFTQAHTGEGCGQGSADGGLVRVAGGAAAPMFSCHCDLTAVAADSTGFYWASASRIARTPRD